MTGRTTRVICGAPVYDRLGGPQHLGAGRFRARWSTNTSDAAFGGRTRTLRGWACDTHRRDLEVYCRELAPDRYVTKLSPREQRGDL